MGGCDPCVDKEGTGNRWVDGNTLLQSLFNFFFFFVFCLCPDHLTEAMKASTCEQVRNIRDVHTG